MSISINSLLNDSGREDCRCAKHNLPYEFWATKNKDFNCKRCIIERDLHTSEIQLLVDAVPMVMANINERIAKANDNLQEDLKTIANFVNQCYYKLNYVMGYKMKIQELENGLGKLIKEAGVLKSDKLKDLALIKKVDSEIDLIESEEHLPLMVSSMAALVSIDRPCRLPALSSFQSNLCNIARTFSEGNHKDELQASSSLNGEAKKSMDSSLSLLKTVHDAGELSENGTWIMNETNCQTVLQALAHRQPKLLVVLSAHDRNELLPGECVAEVAKAVRNCEVHLNFYHSFFKPDENKSDEESLRYFLDNSNIDLSTFVGHLDAAGIARLPTTISFLGLSLNCASNAIAISSINPWEDLQWLLVSVSSNVAASDLCSLPDIEFISLHFPGLTDDRVTSVRPSIEALVPYPEFKDLNFPLCLLSAAGAHRLVQQLQGILVDEVTIELCGSWQPNKLEKDRIATDLINTVGCNSVDWDLVKLYTNV